MESIVFTPSAILDLLSQMDELSDKDIQVMETADAVVISVGESTYTLPTSNATSIEVPSDVVSDVDDVNESGYDEIDSAESIKSGIIKELVKSLLVGGMVRLTTKLLKN